MQHSAKMTSEAAAVPNYCAGDSNMISVDDEPLLSDYRLARYLAVHLVGQVVREAFLAVNNPAKEAEDSNICMSYPKHYIALEQDPVQSEADNGVADTSNTTIESLDDSITVEKLDSEGELFTSTPQRHTDEILKPRNEINLIGQGDQQMQQSDTSTLINNLFDMNDEFEDIEIENEDQEAKERCNVINEAMMNIVDSYFNSAFTMIAETTNEVINTINDKITKVERCAENESFLAHVFDSDIQKNVAFYIDDEIFGQNDREDLNTEPESIKVTPAETHYNNVEQDNLLNVMNNDVDAYLTLNRDEEQFSDEDGVQLLNDPKNFSGMQEVDLMPSTPQPATSTVNFNRTSTNNELMSSSVVAASATSKKSLVQRCKVHGSRLLSCLRGWWRRRTPTSRKVSRVPGISRGYLSPDCRRRGLSLDKRDMRDTSPGEPIIWKYNTVNESLVKSSQWKDYTFESQPGECGEAKKSEMIT